MPMLVTAGAMLRCTRGTVTSVLLVPAGRGVSVGGNPVATVADHKAMVNIRPFGTCSAPANPAASATVMPPCVPATATPWTPGSPSVKAGGLPVVHATCQCQCQWGGVVSVVSPGQQGTMVG